MRQREAIPFREIAKTAFQLYPKRAVLGLALFVGQAFMYNAVTFDLGTLMNQFFDARDERMRARSERRRQRSTYRGRRFRPGPGSGGLYTPGVNRPPLPSEEPDKDLDREIETIERAADPSRFQGRAAHLRGLRAS